MIRKYGVFSIFVCILDRFRFQKLYLDNTKSKYKSQLNLKIK